MTISEISSPTLFWGLPQGTDYHIWAQARGSAMNFLNLLPEIRFFWYPISTKKVVIKFYSNLHKNLTKLPDYIAKMLLPTSQNVS